MTDIVKITTIYRIRPVVVPIIIILAFLFNSCRDRLPAGAGIIPLPVQSKVKSGTFEIGPRTRIVVADTLEGSRQAAAYLSDEIAELTGLRLHKAIQAAPVQGKRMIVLGVTDDAAKEKEEAYRLDIGTDNIQLSAGSSEGLHRGIQTLIQLVYDYYPGADTTGAAVNVSLPSLRISDGPEVPWRGMHLDVASHFMPVRHIIRFLDLLALHKFNRFHWQISASQGWRLEVPGMPELIQTGAWRPDRSGEPWNRATPARDNEPPVYGGFYTEEDVRQVVTYASQLGIEVIPVIPLPTDVNAILASHPETACYPDEFRVATGEIPPESQIPLCVTRTETYQLLDAVFQYLAQVFPSGYVEISGCFPPEQSWNPCENCRQLLQGSGRSDREALKQHFVKKINETASKHGLTLIAGQHLLGGELSPENPIMITDPESFHADRPWERLLLSPESLCRFDMYQEGAPSEPLSSPGLLTYRDILACAPEEVSPPEIRPLGWVGRIPTGYMDGLADVEYMVLPRMSALSEILWTGKSKGFETRWNNLKKRLDLMDVRYWKETDSQPVPQPSADSLSL
ncbi:MAG: beta-N-acetylhexosaminidase [Bacteroidales bacterium]|nr:beta-N-acetylhexosaminidase [Bacteroidales bacterium]